MALVKSIHEFRGRFGGVYFKKGPDGQHVQAMPRHYVIDRLSPRGLRIPGLCGLKSYIHLLIVLALIASWILQAAQADYRTREGKKIRMSWWNWFIHYNYNRELAKLPVYLKPPHGQFDLPSFVFTGFNFGQMVMNLYQSGFYNAFPCYYEHDGDWWLWWEGSMWIISRQPGIVAPERCWYRIDPDPKGVYLPHFPWDDNVYVYP